MTLRPNSAFQPAGGSGGTMPAAVAPELSLVLPCYNEEGCLEATVPPIAHAFERAGISIELVLVDNGSTDGTSQVIDRLIASGLPILKALVPVNKGQGLGIRTGLNAATGRFIGYLGADGQVSADDTRRVFEAARSAAVPTLAKARRGPRNDGLQRRVVSGLYNVLMRVLFLGIPSGDINCNPKIMPADVVRVLELTSTDWFLEAEVMLKIWRLRIPVVEIEVADRIRTAGRSHVRLRTMTEFLRNILSYRFGGPWRAWCTRHHAYPAVSVEARRAGTPVAD